MANTSGLLRPLKAGGREQVIEAEREKPQWERKWRKWQWWCGTERPGALCVICHLSGTALLDRQALSPSQIEREEFYSHLEEEGTIRRQKRCIDACLTLGKSSLVTPVQTVHEHWECILISSWHVKSGYSLIANEAVTGSQRHRQQQLILVFEWQSASPFYPSSCASCHRLFIRQCKDPSVERQWSGKRQQVEWATYYRFNYSQWCSICILKLCTTQGKLSRLATLPGPHIFLTVSQFLAPKSIPCSCFSSFCF